MSRRRGDNIVHREVSLSRHYQGPLPPPEMMLRYEEIAPGAARIILEMAQSQSNHRQGLEDQVVKGNLASERRGQWQAFVVSLAVIGLGGYMVRCGQTLFGLWLAVGTVASLAGVFIYGKRRQGSELRVKADRIDDARHGDGGKSLAARSGQ